MIKTMMQREAEWEVARRPGTRAAAPAHAQQRRHALRVEVPMSAARGGHRGVHLWHGDEAVARTVD